MTRQLARIPMDKDEDMMLPDFFMRSPCGKAVALVVLFVLAQGCAPVGQKTLKIDPRHVVAVQNMQSEIISMLEDLGYEWRPVRDPATGQPVRVAEEYGQYRMLFRAAGDVSVQVEVHIRDDNDITALYFSEVGTDQPSDAAMVYYRRLKERAILEFGADNVSDKRSFMTP